MNISDMDRRSAIRPDVGLMTPDEREAYLFEGVDLLREKIFQDPSEVLSAEMELGYGSAFKYKSRALDARIWSASMALEDSGFQVESSFGVRFKEGESGELEAFVDLQSAEIGAGSPVEGKTGIEAFELVSKYMDVVLMQSQAYERRDLNDSDFDLARQVIRDMYGASDEAIEDYVSNELAREMSYKKLRDEDRERQAPLLAQVNRVGAKINIFNPDVDIKTAKVKHTSGMEIRHGRTAGNWYYEIVVVNPNDHRKAVIYELGYNNYRRGGPEGLILGPSARVIPAIFDRSRSEWSYSGTYIDPHGLSAMPLIEPVVDFLSAKALAPGISVESDFIEGDRPDEGDLDLEISSLRERVFFDTSFLKKGKIKLGNGTEINFKKNSLIPQEWSIQYSIAENGIAVDAEFGFRRDSSGEFVPYSIREERSTDATHEVVELTGISATTAISDDLDKLLTPRTKDKPKFKEGRRLSKKKTRLVPDVERLRGKLMIFNPSLDINNANLVFDDLVQAEFFFDTWIYDRWGVGLTMPDPSGENEGYFFDFGYDYNLTGSEEIKYSRGAHLEVGVLHKYHREVTKTGRDAVLIINQLIDKITSNDSGRPQISATN